MELSMNVTTNREVNLVDEKQFNCSVSFGVLLIWRVADRLM